MKRMIMVLALTGAICLLAAPWSYGQTDATPTGSKEVESKTAAPAENKWQFRVTPYFWAAAMDAKVTVGGYQVDSTITFSEIWRHLEGGGMLHMEAQKEKWGLFLDPTYMKLRADATFVRQRLPNLPAIPRDLTATFEMWMIEGGGFYQLGKWAPEKDRSVTLEAIGGARYWWFSADLDTSTRINPSKSTDWVDPFIGLRMSADLTKNILFTFRGDIGGFGVGSDFSWNGISTIGYRFTKNLVGHVGYRALYFDYKAGTSDKRYEVTMHGPIAGLTFAF
jgi:hypothetical protein